MVKRMWWNMWQLGSSERQNEKEGREKGRKREREREKTKYGLPGV
jgi:hypothetical protein